MRHRFDQRVEHRAIGGIRERGPSYVLRVERARWVHARERLPAVLRIVETVVRGAVAPGAVDEDALVAAARLDRDVVADVGVGRLEVWPRNTVDDRVRNRIQHACPGAGSRRCRVLPQSSRARGIHVSGTVEPQLADERALELVPAHTIRGREHAGRWCRKAIDTGADKRRGAGVGFARGQPERAIRRHAEVANGKRGETVGQRHPGLAVIVGSEDAAVRAAYIDLALGEREADDPARGKAPAAAGVRGERIAVAQVVEIVRTISRFGPHPSGDRQSAEGSKRRAVRTGQDDARCRARLGKLLDLGLRFG